MKWAAVGLLSVAVVSAVFIFGGRLSSPTALHITRATHLIKKLSFVASQYDVLSDGWPLAEDPALILSTILCEERARFEQLCSERSCIDLLFSLNHIEDLLCGERGFFSHVLLDRYEKQSDEQKNPFIPLVYELKAQKEQINKLVPQLTSEERVQLSLGLFIHFVDALEGLIGSFVVAWDEMHLSMR